HRQDGPVAQAALRADARPQVRDLDGVVHQLRRSLLGQLLGHQGGRPGRACRRLHPGLPAPARGPARGHRAAPAAHRNRRHGVALARRPDRGVVMAEGNDTATAETETEQRDERREATLAVLTEALGDAVVDSHIAPGHALWVRVTRDAWFSA